MSSAWPADLPALIDGLDGLWNHSPAFAGSRWLFLRAVGAIFLIAFVSYWVQFPGLVGRRGILPAGLYLRAVRDRFGPRGVPWIPTVLWARADDAAIHAVCAAGVAAALLLIVGVAPALCLLILWVLYLSLVSTGQDFFAFQWDVLLLETGFVSIFIAPWTVTPAAGVTAAVPATGVLLVWWLLFRLMFQSGVVKLTSGDATWRNLTALEYHWWTQPLPTWPAWWLAQAPRWVHRWGAVATYVVEIALPLLIFGPRPLRLAAFGVMVGFQVLIMVTGNYNFFNLLAIALALLLVDDGVWRALGWCPGSAGCGAAGPESAGPPALQTFAGAAVLVVFLVLGGARVWQALRPLSRLPAALRRALSWVEPFRTFNGYGLFRVMTTSRPEIEVQGSADGVTWQTYEFRWKPGDLSRRPRFVEPHQPRLDWQMWFAALSGADRTPWFLPFLARVLTNAQPVLRLLRHNPFPNTPPRYVRALLWEYRFATPAERRETGRWWRRSLIGEYCPPVTRRAWRHPAAG